VTRSRRSFRSLFAFALAAALVIPAQLSGPAPARAEEAAVATHSQVTYDQYSLKLNGRRIMLQAAEFHYFRLPSPDLWRDVLEKQKAAGFNAISLYFDWAYHSPTPGVYDFTGVRDVDRLLREAERAGLWVIARPGPYINAETNGGGFPSWLKQVPGRARTSAPGYTAAYQDWLSHINPIIARHQVTRGGSVLLYNVENEYQVNTDAAYMEALQAKAKADGIVVPITTNDCCDAGSWSSTWGSGPGAVPIPGVDDYPQSFDCGNADTTWGPWGEGVTERVRPDAPLFAAEYQAGAIDLNNTGYEACRDLTGVPYMKYFQKNNLLQSGVTASSYYMGFGGTNWGWLSQPNDVYTSYDYGAAITEARQLTAKYDEFKRQGYFVQALTPLTKTDPTTGTTTSNPALQTVERVNPDTGTRFLLLRHTDRAAGTDDSGVLTWPTPDGEYQVPVRLTGRDAKIFVAGYDLGGQRLVWSTSEIMTHAAIGNRDVALLYGTDGAAGSTVLRYSSRPRVQVLDGRATSVYSANGDLRLNYTHHGLTRVLITGGGRRPLLLLLGTDATAASFWRVDTDAGPVLVRGTSLVRSATVRGSTVDLRADSATAGPVEVFGPASRLVVNGSPVAVRSTSSGSILGRVPGPKPVRLPALTGWRSRTEAPEADPAFDDSGWTVADRTTSLSPTPPITLPVLYSDDYGYHNGSVWYRGHLTATGTETAIKLNAITGKRGNYLVWVNGHYLGSAVGGVEADGEPPVNPDPGAGTFTIPAGLLRPGTPATVSVLVQNMGQNDDWTADEARHRQPRGLIGAAVVGTTAKISWRIQGARGGENLVDPARGPLNTGGLFGERQGWTLPGYADRSWKPLSSLAGTTVKPGVSWYRSAFTLDLPKGQDTSVLLKLGERPPSGYRLMFYLNGWNLGQYGAAIGPQTDFVLPAGLLHQHGSNVLSVAVITTETSALGPMHLAVAGAQRGGVPVTDVRAPTGRGARSAGR
jgi:beta-galactosidase GanA